MRIIILNPHMRSGYSGPTVLMNRLFEHLIVEHDWQASVICPCAPDGRAPLSAYHVVSVGNLSSRLGQLRWIAKATLAVIKNRKQFDVAHLHGAYAFNLMPALALWIMHKPYVILPLAEAGDLAVDSRTSRLPFIRMLRRFITTNARAGFALSAGIQSELTQWGMSEDHVRRLGNPIADSFMAIGASEREDSRSIAFIGQIGPRKSPELIIQALAELRKRGWNEATAEMIGPFIDRHYEQEIKRLVTALRLEGHVLFPGYVEDVAAAFTVIPKVFVLLSSQEGMPGALVEAMAMGMTPIVTDVGAMREIVESSGSGFVVSPDAAELTDVIESLWLRPALQKELSSKASKYAVARYSVEAVAQDYSTMVSGKACCDDS